jgi:hypothetical protein
MSHNNEEPWLSAVKNDPRTEEQMKADYYQKITALMEPNPNRREKAHKVMTPEEYAAMPIIGWHEVCRDVDGFGGVGIRYLGEALSFPQADRK